MSQTYTLRGSGLAVPLVAGLRVCPSGWTHVTVLFPPENQGPRPPGAQWEGGPCGRAAGVPISRDGHTATCQARVPGEAPSQAPVSPQLKEKHKQSGGSVGALEELENAFSLAEESCPGISDKLVVHLVERVQR